MPNPSYERKVWTQGVVEGWERKDEANTKAILFVHGFWGSAAGTWRAPEAGCSFPELMTQDPSLADFDVCTFQYKTNAFGKVRIDRIAQQFDNAIKLSLNRYQLVLIAHSLGGLVCMQYVIDKLKRPERPPVLGLILYGTPTTGLEWLKIIGLVGGFLVKAPVVRTAVSWVSGNVRDLESASSVLQDLHSDWIRHVANGGHASVPATQKAWFPVRVVTGNDDWVVPEHSAQGIYGHIDWHPLETDHLGLAKPSGHKDPRYQAAASFLLDCRQAKSQECVLKLKSASDWVWDLLKAPMIRDWHLQLYLDVPRTPVDANLLAAEGFSICEVAKSRWVFVLPEKPISLGFANGRSATENAWREHNPVYIHGIRLDTAPSEVKGQIGEAISKAMTGGAQAAWNSFFASVRMRIRALGGSSWHDLEQAPPESGGGLVVSEFSAPAAARHLLGREVELEFGFRTIKPSALSEFTWHFKWLTHRAVAEILPHNAAFLYAAPHSIGLTQFEVGQVEDYGFKKLIRVSTTEIVLPDTVVSFHWSRS